MLTAWNCKNVIFQFLPKQSFVSARYRKIYTTAFQYDGSIMHSLNVAHVHDRRTMDSEEYIGQIVLEKIKRYSDIICFSAG
jgi:hypothetical protein